MTTLNPIVTTRGCIAAWVATRVATRDFTHGFTDGFTGDFTRLLASLVAAVFALCIAAPEARAQIICEEGFAGIYPCQNVILEATLTPEQLGGAPGTRINDMWGWTDPETGHEIAIVGRRDGTAFVDVTVPSAPVYLGNLPTHTFAAIWRDMKVYADHAYIVADGASSHGMQVFDLTQLRGVTTPDTLSAVTVYDGIGSSHNIAINEETGFAYAVGVNSSGTTCGGGLHMIDLSEPTAPEFAGCFADTATGRALTGYTHDVQCVIYHGPDSDYLGKEICIGSNETAISVADVTDKGNPIMVANATYPGAEYIHQGWLSEDHRYFYQDDELDEYRGDTTTMTYIWDVMDLDDPQLVATHDHGTNNIDHNLYVRGSRLFQAHYVSGLRISDISDPTSIVEVGYLDTMPGLDSNTSFDGAWSVYPFFESGTILVSSSNGLFIVTPTGLATGRDDPPAIPTGGARLTVRPNPLGSTGAIELTLPVAANVRVSVYDLLGREVRVIANDHFDADAVHTFSLDRGGLPAGTYFVAARGGEVSVAAKFVVVD
jgi:choice-of-anchor B domain-containing protein